MKPTTESHPILGKVYVRVSDCKPCDGTGLDTWHLGCGDSRPPSCPKCDGCGQVAHVKPVSEPGSAWMPWEVYG